jgi:hypothetical protein
MENFVPWMGGYAIAYDTVYGMTGRNQRGKGKT